MPTRYRRIAVTEDPELAAALRAVAPLPGFDARPARLVRDLALRGAEAVLADEEHRRSAIESLIAWSTEAMTDEERALLTDRDAAWPSAGDGAEAVAAAT